LSLCYDPQRRYECFIFSCISGNDSEWVDLVEPEIRHILEIERNSKSGQGGNVRTPLGSNSAGLTGVTATSTPAVTKQFQPGGSSSSGLNKNNNNSNNTNINSHPGGNNGTNPNGIMMSKLQAGNGITDISASPIIHTKAVHHSPPNNIQSPKVPKKFDLNNAYRYDIIIYILHVKTPSLVCYCYLFISFSSKKTLRSSQSQEILAGPSTSQAAVTAGILQNKVNKSPRVPPKVQRSNSGSGQQRWPTRPRVPEKSPKGGGGARPKEFTQTLKGAKITRNAMTKLG
jgi:hypothetical protein